MHLKRNGSPYLYMRLYTILIHCSSPILFHMNALAHPSDHLAILQASEAHRPDALDDALMPLRSRSSSKLSSMPVILAFVLSNLVFRTKNFRLKRLAKDIMFSTVAC